MNFVIFFIFTFMINQDPNPEVYIGKTIAEVSKQSELNLVNQQEDKKTYMINEASIFGANIRTKLITTDLEGIVQEIAYGFDFKIEKDFYELMVKTYGEPTKMFKQGPINKITHDRVITHGYIGVQERSTSIDCSFEEDPIFIIWQLSNFSISIALPPNQNTSMITYRGK